MPGVVHYTNAVRGLFKSIQSLLYTTKGVYNINSVGHICAKWIRKGRLSRQACVSLHVPPSSLKPTPTLICSAPDLLLFCHPDMFNKYCLARTRINHGLTEVLLSVRTADDGLDLTAFLSLSQPSVKVRKEKNKRINKLYLNFLYCFLCGFLPQSTRKTERKRECLAFQSLDTKATKHVCVNISGALDRLVQDPAARCLLGLRSVPLCDPWQTVWYCAAGHGCSVVGRQQCLHACRNTRKGLGLAFLSVFGMCPACSVALASNIPFTLHCCLNTVQLIQSVSLY